MSYQPMNAVHFLSLLGMTICMALVGQGIGLFFGAAFDIQVAVFLSPTCAIPFVLICSFCVNLNSLPYYLNWIGNISFMQHGFDGSLLSIYGYDRPPLSCSEPYCYFRYPQKFLEQFHLHQSYSYFWPFSGMLVIFLVLRVSTYLVLRFKLRHMRWSVLLILCSLYFLVLVLFVHVGCHRYMVHSEVTVTAGLSLKSRNYINGLSSSKNNSVVMSLQYKKFLNRYLLYRSTNSCSIFIHYLLLLGAISMVTLLG